MKRKRRRQRNQEKYPEREWKIINVSLTTARFGTTPTWIGLYASACTALFFSRPPFCGLFSNIRLLRNLNSEERWLAFFFVLFRFCFLFAIESLALSLLSISLGSFSGFNKSRRHSIYVLLECLKIID